MNTGDPFPQFILKDEDGMELDSNMLKGIRHVIYFYSKDGTVGCTKEALDFTGNYVKFMFRNIPVFGVSKDSPETHKKFKEKNDLKIKLLSDQDHNLMSRVGAWGPKTMYGKVTEGAIRSTFIIGKDGKIEAVWKKVKVDGHADIVLEKALSLYKNS
jgi:thioredoxin-dependent peroxiredoxin